MSLHFTCQLAGTVSGISTVNGARCCASTSVTCSTRSSPHVDWICSPAGGSNRNVSSGIGWVERSRERRDPVEGLLVPDSGDSEQNTKLPIDL